MTSDHETLRRLIVGTGETRIDSFDAADRVLAAGWRQDADPINLLIPYDAAVTAFGTLPNLNSDPERASFFAVWAMLQVELEAAIRAERKEDRR